MPPRIALFSLPVFTAITQVENLLTYVLVIESNETCLVRLFLFFKLIIRAAPTAFLVVLRLSMNHPVDDFMKWKKAFN